MNEMRNPFKEESTDLLVLDSKEIMNSEVVHLVRNMEDVKIFDGPAVVLKDQQHLMSM